MRVIWNVLKSIWAGIVLVGYGIFAILSFLVWWDTNETNYSNPHRQRADDGKQQPPARPGDERKAS
jgi:hypothetical protein